MPNAIYGFMASSFVTTLSCNGNLSLWDRIEPCVQDSAVGCELEAYKLVLYYSVSGI
jgi:hypothetical protein